MAQLGTGEGGGDGIAAEGHRIIPRHRLFVALRDVICEQGDVDVGLADEKGVHA